MTGGFGVDNEGGVMSRSRSGILRTDGAPLGAGLDARNDASAADRIKSPILEETDTGTAAWYDPYWRHTK